MLENIKKITKVDVLFILYVEFTCVHVSNMYARNEHDIIIRKIVANNYKIIVYVYIENVKT